MGYFTRVFMSVFLAVLLAAPAPATHLRQSRDDGRIVPGHRIGPVALGISRGLIEAMDLEGGCPVTADYDKSDQAIQVKTEWGGACQVSGDIQVGVSAGAILATFRLPDAIVEDARYPHATAFWLRYVHWGIAFRVLVMSNGSSITQAIAVFPGTASVSRCRALCGSVGQLHY